MRTFAALSLLLFASAATAAELSGVVVRHRRDAIEPAVGARVVLQELQAVTFTDAEGRYRFADVPPGDYTIRIESLVAGVWMHPSQSIVRRRFTLLDRNCWAYAGHVFDVMTGAPIAGASVNGAPTDGDGYYFVPLGCNPVPPFGTTEWTVEADDYRPLNFLVRREWMLRIVDYALRRSTSHAPIRSPDP